MRGPLLGFRAWKVAQAIRLPAIITRAEENAAKFLASPELEEWLTAKLPQPNPRRPRALQEPGTLMPLNPGRSDTWAKPGSVCFSCKPHRHQKPTWSCECGLYAWLTVDQLLGPYPYGDVVGAVIAWGHIIVHGTEGFRAEWMRVVALSSKGVPPIKANQSRRDARLAAERLGVPCVPLDKLEEVGREFGNPIRWEYHFE